MQTEQRESATMGVKLKSCNMCFAARCWPKCQYKIFYSFIYLLFSNLTQNDIELKQNRGHAFKLTIKSINTTMKMSSSVYSY